ncbi:helix-turn-helix domain-containing protein [Streptomyces sp. BV286]|uniref:PucR family transcriptional regulator n=1 Tax=unclassified Streptomyces TaxID=2593676 RepID=UPI001C2E40B2|nr:PucR family transcriptional regulator [Streptomyces sp. BV286]MBV1939021.1 helix-turn-helix domain-containing protein [Streptomyces sp. BV286]
MTVVHEREPVTEILRTMAVDGDVCGELVRAARAHSPEVARLTEAESLSHVTAMIRAAGEWFATFDGIEQQDFTAALLLGADRAGQGVAMTAVLRGVQAALNRAVEITVDRCRAAGVADGTVLDVVLRLNEYGDAVERHVINGYRAAERATPHETAEVRTNVLRRLLVGGVVPSPLEMAGAGMRPGGGPFHCLVTGADDPTSARLLTDGLSGPGTVFGLVEGRLAGLCHRRPEGRETPTSALVVVSPAAPLEEIRPLYRLCVRAVEIGVRRGRHGLYELTDLAAEIALADQPLMGEHLSTRLLGALDRADGFHRQLALTALTFLDNGRRLDQTATALFTHPNTVRYRLGRLQQITGHTPTDLTSGPLSEPLSTLNWWWALTTWLGEDRDPPSPS